MPISQALAKRSDDFEGIHTCTVDDSLGDIFQTIKNHIVVDKKGKQPEGSSLLNNGVGKLVGVIGLSDILIFYIGKRIKLNAYVCTRVPSFYFTYFFAIH